MSKIPFTSFYFNLANRELNWLVSDTEENYKNNLKDRYFALKINGWLDKKITYKFNSLGFRSDEFTNDPTAMFLGCSNTMGVGLPVEETWANIVAKTLNLNYANLAIGGGSPDLAFRMCLGYIDKVKPKIVFYREPPPGRLELMTVAGRNGVVGEQLFLGQLDPNYDDKFLLKYAAEQSNILLNYQKNSLAIQSLCLERNIKFVFLEDKPQIKADDLARDLAHFGTKYNKEFSSYALSKCS
jgi:hypothetical protein